MASRDEVLIKIRMQGGRAAAADVKAARAQVDGLGAAGSRASGTLRGAGVAVGNLASQASAAAGKVAKLTAATAVLGGGALAVQAAKAGAAYNKMQDSQMVAFTTMLRSESKARALMGDIQALALKSPVLDAGSTGDAARTLLNYGLSLKQVLPLVEALGDASAASGKSITEVMPQAALALGQIEGKGKLQAEELGQITEAVGINRKVLAKELGLTSKQFADAFKPGSGIGSDRAIPAIQRALQAGSKGAADKLAATTEGQVAKLDDVTSRQFGRLTRPWYDAYGDTAGGIANILARKGLTGGQKVSLSFEVANKKFGPLVRQAEAALKDAKIGQKISDGIEEYTPRMITALANGVVAGAPRLASATARAFGDMGTWGKLLTVAFLLRRFNVPVWGAAGKVLGAATGRSAASTAAAEVGKDGAITGRLGGRMSSIGNALGKTMGAAMGLYALNEFAHQTAGAGVQDVAKKLSRGMGLKDAPGSLGNLSSDVKESPQSKAARKRALAGPDADLEAKRDKLSAQLWSDPMVANQIAEIDKQIAARKRARAKKRAMGGTVGPGETTLVGERGPEIARFPPGTKIIPNHALGRQRSQASSQQSRRRPSRVIREQPIQVNLNGREIYREISRQTEIEGLAH